MKYFLSFSLLALLFSLIQTAALFAGVEIRKPAGMSEPPARMALSPPRLDLNIGKKPANGATKLFNLTDEPVTVVATVHHWDLDENNRVRIIEPTPQSLDQWMIVNPVRFTIPPHRFQTIRLSIRPNVSPEDGEHRAIIYFTQVLPDQKTPEVGIQVNFRMGAIVYGLAGDIIRDGRLGPIRVQTKGKTGKIKIDVTSTGNAGIRLDGHYTVQPRTIFSDQGKAAATRNPAENNEKNVLETGPLTTLPVLAGTRRTLVTPFALPKQPGEYVVLVQGKLGDNTFRRQFPLTISGHEHSLNISSP